MSGTSVIIIGAGLAGLSTGCYAQINGYQSQILEHHSQAGGVAAAWKRGEYLIDGGIHFAMGYKPGTRLHQVYRQLGIVPANRFVELETYGRFIHEPSSWVVEVTQDLGRLAKELIARFPADSQLVEKLVAGASSFRGLDMSEMGLSRPPELSGLGNQLKELWAMRPLLRYVIGKYGRRVGELVRSAHDPVLSVFLENLFTPDVPAYFILMLLGLLADGQIGLVEGGCHDFVGAIEKRYGELGGKLRYQATVEKILVENDRAVGVRLEDGSEERADAVVSAADGYSTIFRMLGEQYINDKIRRRYATWQRFAPLLTVSYGVARQFSDWPSFTSVLLERPLTVGGKGVPGLFVRIFNYSPRFAPPGKTVVQVEFETEWDYWSKLQRTDRPRYDGEKKRVAADVLDRLERHFPGVQSQVEVTDVATPYTTWRYTLNDKAAWEGWLMTPKQMTTAIERALPGLKAFYMAGQWVMPGGGVAPVLYSGRHAVQLLCRDDKRQFLATAG